MNVSLKVNSLDYDANATFPGWNLVGKLFSVCGDADGDSEKDYGRLHSKVNAAIVMVKGYIIERTYLPL